MTSKLTCTDSTQPDLHQVLPDSAWKRLRHNGQMVRDDVVGGLPPMLRPVVWKEFKKLPMARSACLLLSLLEPQDNIRDAGLYRRRSRRPGADLFDDMPSAAERARAKEIYAKLCERHSERLASCRWLRPLLAGRARWLATHPDAYGSAWGRQMRRKKAGRHTQRTYQEQGWHPLPSVRKAWGLAENGPHASDGPKL